MRGLQINKRLLLTFGLLALLLVFVPGALAAEEAAAGGDNPLTPLGINSGLLFVQTFNFLLIAFVLGALLWRPAVNMLDARSAQIQKGLEDAAAAAKARQNAEAEAEKILAQARIEANKLVEEARGRGDELARTIQDEARGAAEKIRQDAQAEAAVARNAELAGLRDQVLNISVAVASRVVGETLDAKKQKALVDDFFSKVPADAKKLGGKVEVVSAMPLTDDEQKKAQKELGAEAVEFSVDPAILGGLIVRSADKVIDGSVRSNLSNLSSRLN